VWSVPPRTTATAAARLVTGSCVLAALAAPRTVVPVAPVVAWKMAARTCLTESTRASTGDWIARRTRSAVANAAAVYAVTTVIAFYTQHPITQIVFIVSGIV